TSSVIEHPDAFACPPPPYSTPIKELLADNSLDSVPDEYHHYVKKLLRTEYVENILLLIIILLMITKPF
ncbi:hypothetical protein KL964_20070, partial [Bacillus spizizenii]|nr:hypothetical protein [Bacillus spizizenii]